MQKDVRMVAEQVKQLGLTSSGNDSGVGREAAACNCALHVVSASFPKQRSMHIDTQVSPSKAWNKDHTCTPCCCWTGHPLILLSELVPATALTTD